MIQPYRPTGGQQAMRSENHQGTVHLLNGGGISGALAKLRAAPKTPALRQRARNAAFDLGAEGSSRGKK